MGQEIVAGDDRDAMRQPGSLQNLPSTPRARRRIHAAGVRDNMQLGLLQKHRRETLQNIEKIAGVTSVGIALLLQGKDRHRQFGQVFEGEIIETAALRQTDRCIHAVAPEAAAVADAHGFHGNSWLMAEIDG